MNISKPLLCLNVVTALCGCAAPNSITLRQSVGPVHPSASPHLGTGRLIVYSALDGMDTLDADHPKHSGYTICYLDGKFLCQVDNRTGSFYQSPAVVALPTGSYQIRARATNVGLVTVPVVIESAQDTIVDLEGSTLPQSPSQPDDRWVRLPGGQVIGQEAK